MTQQALIVKRNRRGTRKWGLRPAAAQLPYYGNLYSVLPVSARSDMPGGNSLYNSFCLTNLQLNLTEV